MKKLLPGVFILLLVAIALLLAYLEIPYNVRSKGIVKPALEWSVQKGSDGGLVTMLENHQSGNIHTYQVHEFERGDVVQFLFNEALMHTDEVLQGDTIARVFSNDLQMRLVEKQGALGYEKALLQARLTGEKPEAVQMALEQVALARQELQTQQKQTERVKKLYEEDVVSEQEYELAVNDLRIKEYALEIAESNYEAITAGEKEEEIGTIRARIAALENERDQLKSHRREMNILSPVDGQIVRQRNPEETGNEEVIRVADLSSLVVFVPVDPFEEQYIRTGQQVSIKSSYSRKQYTGEVVQIDNSVQLINNQPKIFVSVLVDNEHSERVLFPNMVVDARITSDPVTLGQYLIRMSRVVHQN